MRAGPGEATASELARNCEPPEEVLYELQPDLNVTDWRGATSRCLRNCAVQGVASALVVLAAAVASQWLLMLAARQTLRSTLDQQLLSIAQVAASQLDADAHALLVRPDQLNGPEYRQVVRPLRQLLRYVPHLKYAYTVRSCPDGIRFGVDAADPVDADGDGVLDQARLGELYPDADPAMRCALTLQQPSVTLQPFADKWGQFRSAFVPVYRRDGRFECVVGIDVESDLYDQNVGQMSWAVAVGTGFASLTAVCVGLGVFVIQRSRHQSVAELQASEAKLRKLYDLSPLGIVLSDMNGRILQANLAIEEIFGYPFDEVRGLTIADLVRPASADAVPVPFGSLWESGRYGPHDTECLRGDGVRVDVRLNGVLVRASDGTPSVWSIVENTTEQRRAEEAIRESRDRLSRIAENVPGMIYQFRLRPDGSSQVPYSSAGIEQIFGVKPEDMAVNSERLFDLLHPDDLDSVRRSIAESARTLEPWQCEFRVNHPTLGTIWVEGKSLPQREIGRSRALARSYQRYHPSQVDGGLARLGGPAGPVDQPGQPLTCSSID